MKINPSVWFSLIALAVVLGTFLSLFQFRPPETQYPAGDLLAFRKTKNTLMKTQVGAPFYANPDFDSLVYFPPNPEELYVADVQTIKNGEEIDLMPDRPGYPSHRVAGLVVLEKVQWRDTLLILKDLEEKVDSLYFIPFSDASNGSETYGGGRYLNVVWKPGKLIKLDFNFAYNPYCAYREDFVCAKIPTFNRLSRAILAGEKVY